MSRTGLALGALVVIAVLWFIISKAQTALDNGTKNLRQEIVTPEMQAQDIIEQGMMLPAE